MNYGKKSSLKELNVDQPSCGKKFPPKEARKSKQNKKSPSERKDFFIIFKVMKINALTTVGPFQPTILSLSFYY